MHRAPTWTETVNAPTYGLHTFITAPSPEPWHMQCVEMRGYQTWIVNGRRDPLHLDLPGEHPTPDPDEDDMPRFIYIAKPPNGSPADWPWLVVADATVRPAISSDTTQGLEQVVIADVGQYNNLRKAAGV